MSGKVLLNLTFSARRTLAARQPDFGLFLKTALAHKSKLSTSAFKHKQESLSLHLHPPTTLKKKYGKFTLTIQSTCKCVSAHYSL